VAGSGIEQRDVGARTFGVLAFLLFLAVSWSSYHLWPFYVFDMYSTADHDRSSRVVALDERGGVHEIGAFSAWRCRGLSAADLSAPRADCPDTDHVDASDRERLWWLTTSADPGQGAGVHDLLLVRRTWRFDDPSNPHDCPLTRCRAR